MGGDQPLAASSVQADHFARLVRRWSHLGPPLRPSAFDTAVVQDVISHLPAGTHAAILGLTPETAACTWPAATTLLAIDHSAEMVRALWPPRGAPEPAYAALGDWRALPVATGALDMVFGDASYALLAYPSGFAQVAAEVARVLKPGAWFVVRTFLRPDVPEPPGAIAAALAGGHIHSVHALKLRLLAAEHGTSGPGTCLHDVWRAWKQLPPVPVALAGCRGWSADELSGMEAYQGLAARYYLPTLAELRATHSTLFHERACHVGTDDMAHRAPTLVLERPAC